MGQDKKFTEGHRPKGGVIGPSQGAAAPQPSPFGPNFGRLTHTALLNVGVKVLSKFNVSRAQFGVFHVGIKHIPWDQPLLSTYKRRLPPPHFIITTQERHNVTRREELHSYLSSLPSFSVGSE